MKSCPFQRVLFQRREGPSVSWALLSFRLAVYGQGERNNADTGNGRGFLLQGFRKIFDEDFAWSKMLLVDHFLILGKQQVISVGKTDQWYVKDRIAVEGVQPIEGICTHKLFYDLLDESIRI